MTRNASLVVIPLAVATVAGLALGLLSAYATARGGSPMPASQIAITSMAFAAVVTAVLTLLRGNRGQASASDDAQRDAKLFARIPNRAVAYVFRDGFYGKFLGLDVSLDGIELGQTRGKTFFRLELAPGRHTFVGINPQDGARAELVLEVAGGELHFIEQTLGMGAGSARTGFNRVPEEAGMARVRRCRLLLPTHSATPAAAS